MALVQINSLKKSYRSGVRALKKISFDLQDNEVLALLGPNGAGKTTALKSIMGIIKSGGEILFKSRPLTTEDALQNIVFVPEEKNLYDHFSAKQLSKIAKQLTPKFDSSKFDCYMEVFELNKNQKFSHLSNGMKTLVYLSLAFSTDSLIYILDEPTWGLDPLMRNTVLREIRNLTFNGKSVIYTSHILSEVEKTADRIVILNKGKITEFDSMDEIKLKYAALSSSQDLPSYISKKRVSESDFLYIVRSSELAMLKNSYPLARQEEISFEDIFEALVRRDSDVD
ncbi:MAG TPA: ABC transporter ATP-binding protein [Petrotogaceae bacterium]|nr:ABC transporter ATP-binding protein [Petrotogaceae bacterium]HPA93334.1 ABC transporter ATP-binding protein [Petrotogaceae bacterium]HPO26553.1 ABC transporter ATP-binding protein [Petrotogaceae bacterium]HQC41061.1 ABC transporter ATP-binding protein [Petrotogaceae bacterium]HQO12377.1 ABC transporter ATP-binding protein [Petrotogaceae bacterium]